MAYINLDFMPGMQANGTTYTNRNVWLDGDRVRWHNNALRPIGGWEPFTVGTGQLNQVLTDPVNQKARALLAWKGNDGASLYAIGHNQGLVAWNRGGPNVYDITPTDFTPQPAGLDVEDGYGNWFYGSTAYGTERPYDEQTSPIFNWCLRLWGQNLLAAQRGAPSKLYEWDTGLGNVAEPVANAPVDFDCFHVTEQRIVMTAGSPDAPRLVQWSTSEDNTVWTPSLQNQAGFQTLTGIGRFREIVSVGDQILLIGETDAHVARYVGPPYIFSFDKVGDDCGIIAGGAVAATENFAIWPGQRSFYIFDGSLKRLDCPVMDRMASIINTPNAGKTVAFINPEWAEAWWLFQGESTGSTNAARSIVTEDDVNSYIAYNFKEGHWTTGTLDRSVGGGHPVTRGPIMIGHDGYAYSHEQAGVVPYTNTPDEVFIESGPIELTDAGQPAQYITAIMPDMIDVGEADIELIGRDRPGAPEIIYGPYMISFPTNSAQPVPTRARGHSVRMRVKGRQSDFTMGSMRLDVLLGGRK